MRVPFEVAGEVNDVEVIAVGKNIRQIRRLRKFHGTGRWRKLKGIGAVRLPDGTIHKAELHWYEASGIGKKELKIKRLLD